MIKAPPLTHSRVLSLAWPVVLAQAATAMTGVVDTAVMGRFGDKTDLAAVAIAAVSFGFIYWSFGFTVDCIAFCWAAQLVQHRCSGK